MTDVLVLNGSDLTLEEVRQVVYDRRPVKIDESRIPLLRESRQVLFDMAAEGKPVYGLNHGVGWNKDREFGVEFFEQFNRNLIRSHSVGVMPTMVLKVRKKDVSLEKPDSIHTSEARLSGLSRMSCCA